MAAQLPRNYHRETELAEVLRLRRVRLSTKEEGSWYNPYNIPSIAKEIGITPACLSNWENGVNPPSTFELWEKWARAVKAKFAVDIIVP